LWRGTAIKIVEVAGREKAGKPYVAVFHANIVLGNSRRNLECLRKTLAYIHDYDIALLILPYAHPYGPVTPSSTLELKNYLLSTKTGYLRDLVILAKNYGVNILLPGFYESAGPKKYVSALMVRGSIDGSITRYRKMFVTGAEKSLGISSGSELRVFSVNSLTFTVMLDNELFYPELARLNLSISDFLVAGIPQNAPLKYYDNVVKTIACVNKAYVVVVGARVFKTGILYDSMPTILVSPEGDAEFKYSEDEQGLVLIPAEKLKRSRVKDFNELAKIYSLYRKVLERGLKHGAGESSSGEDAESSRPR